MRIYVIGLLALLLTACTSAPATMTVEQAEDYSVDEAAPVPELPDLGPAPAIENEVWLNVDEPLRLENLRGQVVLLEMWTFG